MAACEDRMSISARCKSLVLIILTTFQEQRRDDSRRAILFPHGHFPTPDRMEDFLIKFTLGINPTRLIRA